jgi:ABC-type amino acid transport system permease subunit
LAEIMTQAIRIKSIPPYDVITPFVLAAFLYIALTFPISFWLDRWGNRRKQKMGL